MEENLNIHTSLLEGNKKLKGVKGYSFSLFSLAGGIGGTNLKGINEEVVFEYFTKKELFFWRKKDFGDGRHYWDLRGERDFFELKVSFETEQPMTNGEVTKYYDALFSTLQERCEQIKRTSF